MTDRDEVLYPPDHRQARWYVDSPVMVRWSVQREIEQPVLSAVGTVRVLRDVVSEDYDEADDNAYYQDVGKIHIVKPFLCGADINIAMDALGGEHEYLAAAVLDGGEYDDAFCEWFEREFGLWVGGDPVFVLALQIAADYQDPDVYVAAHTALDALATFGSSTSPLVTFDIDLASRGTRPGLRGEASWTWVHALRAKRWKHVYVAARP